MEGSAMEDVGQFYGHLVYFADIWYIFGDLVFLVFGIFLRLGCSNKNLAIALAAWSCGHRIRLRNKETRVRIPPENKVFRES
jgi:hypothetical protein